MEKIKVIFTFGYVWTYDIVKDSWTFAGDNLEYIDYEIFSPYTFTGTELRSVLLNDKVAQVIINDEIVYSK